MNKIQLQTIFYGSFVGNDVFALGVEMEAQGKTGGIYYVVKRWCLMDVFHQVYVEVIHVDIDNFAKVITFDRYIYSHRLATEGFGVEYQF